MDPLFDTTALTAMLVVSAAMIVLGLRKHVLVHRRSICPVCRVDSRSCHCRRG